MTRLLKSKYRWIWETRAEVKGSYPQMGAVELLHHRPSRRFVHRAEFQW